MHRRTLLKMAGGAAAAALVAPMVNRGRYKLFAHSSKEYSARAVGLVGRSLVVDMLNPMTLDADTEARWLSDPESFGPAEARAFKESGISVFHLGGGGGGRNAHARTLDFVAKWNGFVAGRTDIFTRVDSAADLDGLKSNGKLGVLIGVQNADHFQTLDDVDYFRGLGLRVAQLTYNARNLVGSGATERRDDGLSDYGVALVERMNRAGVAVDVSHCGDRTTLDAFEASRRPVLITHSNCRALVPSHPRLKTDEALKKMAATGGVMGITGMRMFVRDREPTTVGHVLDHYDYVARLVGVEHVGLGSDSDLYGYDRLPAEVLARMHAGYKGSYGLREKIDIEGLNHPRRVYDLTEGLIGRKYSDRDIELILGGNFKRALSQIWSARKS
ncbi:MAG TPA: membrane dipeptidase [Pyrinomonadaceae bacterium]|nr:membrane dipeptidase [Pyrinomonadaceae bacterium]